MVGPQKNIFKKMSISEKKALFRDVAGVNQPLLIKSEGSLVFNLKAMEFLKDEILVCQYQEGLQIQEMNEKVTVNFQFQKDNFFCKSEMMADADGVRLRMNEDLFKIQRRSGSRIEIPEDFNASFVLLKIETEEMEHDCQLVDVSTGGAKVLLPMEAPLLKVGEKGLGMIRFGSQRPIQLSVEVRYAQNTTQKGNLEQEVSYGSATTKGQIVGFQFLNMNQSLEEKLYSIMRYVQIDIYDSLNRKSK